MLINVGWNLTYFDHQQGRYLGHGQKTFTPKWGCPPILISFHGVSSAVNPEKWLTNFERRLGTLQYMALGNPLVMQVS